jgi:hypothetical protein
MREPDLYWSEREAPTRPAYFSFGPEQITLMGVPFEYYVPLDGSTARLVALGSGDIADFVVRMFEGRMRRQAHTLFGDRAQAALNGIAREEIRQRDEREQCEQREREEANAAASRNLREMHEAIKRRAEAEAAHSLWMARLRDDLEGVLTALLVGREAKLQDWAAEAGFMMPGPGKEERERFLAAATAQVQQEEAARIKRRKEAVEQAEREIREATQKIEWEAYQVRRRAEEAVTQARRQG